MKYFTYNLKPVGEGLAAGPDILLPDGSKTGYIVNNYPYVYYGAAEIEDISILKDYNGIEITEAEFNSVYNPPIPPSGSI